MTERELIQRANEVLERLFALDEAVANARAFRALLEDLHARDFSAIDGPHVAAIGMVRAGILRAAIGTVMACLDPGDRRGNRASVGQILFMLRDEAVVAVFPEPGASATPAVEALAAAQRNYQALLNDELFERGRRLRNDAIAHVLIPDDPTPTVTYETIYRLHDEAERLMSGLYRVCHRGTPASLEHQARLADQARIFWDTYFRGMALTPSSHGSA